VSVDHVTGQAEPVDENPEGRQRGSTQRWRSYSALFLIYLAYGVLDLFDRNGPVGITIGLGLLAVFIALYLALPYGRSSGETHAAVWMPLAMLAVFAAYAVIGGEGSMMLLIYLAVAVVSFHPPYISIPVVVALCAVSILLPPQVDSWDEPDLHYSYAASIALVSLVVYGSRRITASDMALLQAQSEVRRLAKEQERMRIGRDLHDILGHSLTTVVVKSELAQRLVPIDPDQAATEMGEVAALARQSLADVRSTVAGYREMSLAGELATAREVLRAAGIEAELPSTVESVPGDRRELFGWVVREGVTNAVRHSRARHVTVRFLDRGIEVVDDGVGAVAAMGTGLRGLTERVAAAGGRLTAGATDGGGWRLAVEL
jgi:two-component system, NarL family, sensor histidine kinase DesK